MNENHITKISDELRLRPEQVRATAELFDQAATVPFIARYRKEITGSLDFDVSFMWDRVGQPTTDAEGNTPKPDDYRLMIGIKWSL